MKKIIFASLVLFLSACATAVPQVGLTPQRVLPLTGTVGAPVNSPLVPSPTSTITNLAELTATPVADGPIVSIFSNISHSTDTIHLKCDPLEIVFDLTVTDPAVDGVIFFFRMKDKATGLVSNWSNGEEMKTPGNGNFEFILQADAIPNEARYKEAWLQYQFVAANSSQQDIGRSQIFADQITFTPACP